MGNKSLRDVYCQWERASRESYVECVNIGVIDPFEKFKNLLEGEWMEDRKNRAVQTEQEAVDNARKANSAAFKHLNELRNDLEVFENRQALTTATAPKPKPAGTMPEKDDEIEINGLMYTVLRSDKAMRKLVLRVL